MSSLRRPPAWSPVGTHNAFTSDGCGNSGEILVADLRHTGKIWNVSNDPAHDQRPGRLEPSGQSAMFGKGSTRTGRAPSARPQHSRAERLPTLSARKRARRTGCAPRTCATTGRRGNGGGRPGRLEYPMHPESRPPDARQNRSLAFRSPCGLPRRIAVWFRARRAVRPIADPRDLDPTPTPVSPRAPAIARSRLRNAYVLAVSADPSVREPPQVGGRAPLASW